MKEIYIVLTYTGTVLSRLIKLYTRKKYSHVSLTFDKSLNKLYSFGRLNPYNPFMGGFVIEGINVGTFNRFKNTDAIIFSLKITDEQFENLQKDVRIFIKQREKYKFNIMGLFLTVLNIRLKKQNSFYCAEFVKYIIEKQGIKTNLPDVVKPYDFTKISDINVIYEGKLHEYKEKILCD